MRFPAIFLLILACFQWGCATDEAGRPGPYQEKVVLSHEMTDEQILGKLGYDPRLMKKRIYQGPDGFSTVYVNRAGDEVTITRSVVTGTSVMETRKITRDWTLGPLLRE